MQGNDRVPRLGPHTNRKATADPLTAAAAATSVRDDNAVEAGVAFVPGFGARSGSRNELLPREGISTFCILNGKARSVLKRMVFWRERCQSFQKRVGDLVERENSIDGIQQNCFSRHSENDGCRLVLGDGESSGELHLKQALCSICSHPSEQYAESILLQGSGARGKQDVDGGKMAIHGFAPVDVNGMFTSCANDGHVVSARGQQRARRERGRRLLPL
jgi:hypothetical protein